MVENVVNELQSEDTNLRREMGLFSSSNVLIGIMVGSGIFYLGSYVLMRCGMSLGLALLVWIIGGIVTLLSGLCYAELGSMMPKAGGIYVYLREAFGEKVAFVAGISSFILGSCGSTAAIAIFFASLFNNFDGVNLSSLTIKLIAAVSVVFLTVINIFGVKKGSIVQNIFTVAKLIPIFLILIVGIVAGNQTPDLSLTPVETESVSLFSVFGMIAFATVATFWAYEGWTNLNVISEEIKNPKKNLPRALALSVVFVMAVYVLFNFAIYRVVPFDLITSNFNEYYLTEDSSYLFLGTEAARILFGTPGTIMVSVCMVVAVFGSLNGCILVFPRTCLAIARDGMLPKKCAEVNEKYKTPVVALIVHMIISIILIFMRNLDQMTSLVTFTAMLFSVMTFYSIIKLRKKYPDMERPYRVKTPLIYITIAIMLGLLINTFISDIVTSLIGTAVTGSCYIVYIIIKKVNNKNLLENEEVQGEENENNNI